MKSIFFSMVLLLSLLFLLANVNEAAVPCNAVEAKAAACVGFAMGRDSNLAPACCSGLQQLAATVKTLEDKKAICRCLKGAVKAFPSVKDSLLNKIPTACHINVGFPVSLSINCETIH
ncbi:non-specific lipid-transfer protein C, cotyledon-specific isoform-like [Tripterygium wilfordii]|uniref:non-specific lipid-transfer protein C, cotyledon-specific isoform-like n=1 Tax=Tripterygium wilfordii TaxID=458696 RepID=UPI0018F7F6E1|nr:non-specific lipid-transfer protein C, cotyledon-specific isoform-like [Tripterygium wilfordii]